MVSNIVESQLLVEQTNGKYYITVGLGLASNVSNIRFKVMNSSGSMSSVSATKTGSSSANGDSVNHYRLQVSSLDLYISPIMYVNPMGRDVQFFIKPNISSAIVGTGIYSSQMISQESTSTSSQNEKENNATLNSSSQKETKETSTSIETNPTEETTVPEQVEEQLAEKETTVQEIEQETKDIADTFLKAATVGFTTENNGLIPGIIILVALAGLGVLTLAFGSTSNKKK